MEPLEYRSVIKFLNMQGKSPSVIFEEMFSVYQEECLSYVTVKYWVRKFKSGFLSIHDSPREGRPNFVVTEDSVCQVKTLVLEDRRVTIKQLAAITKMSVCSIETILHDHLHMSTAWVPRLLTPNQKEQRADSCKELIELESKDTRFFYRITRDMDETWVHHFDPEMKSSSMQWKTPSSPTPKKARVEPSCGKVMLSCFWDRDGIIMTDYLEQGHTITGNYYSALLAKLRSTLAKKRRGKLQKGILLLHDNAPAHRSMMTVQYFTHRCSVVSKFSLIRRINQI